MKIRILKAVKENKAMVIVGAFLAAVMLVFILTGIRTAGEERTAKNLRMEREIAENHYVSELRNYLSEQGYDNSGVNLTKVWEGEEGYKYNVLIHNDRIRKEGEEAKERILRTVKELGEQLDCNEITAAFL